MGHRCNGRKEKTSSSSSFPEPTLHRPPCLACPTQLVARSHATPPPPGTPRRAQLVRPDLGIDLGDDLILQALENTDGTLVTLGHSSTDGGLLARRGADGTVLWSTALPGSAGVLRDCTLTSNANLLVCGKVGDNGLVTRLDAQAGVIWQMEEPFSFSGDEKSVSYVFSTVMEAGNGDTLLRIDGKRRPARPSAIVRATSVYWTMLGMSSRPEPWRRHQEHSPSASSARVSRALPSKLELSRHGSMSCLVAWGMM